MPNIFDIERNSLLIDSVEDIPERYRDIVVENVNTNFDLNYDGTIIPGIKGYGINDTQLISKEFNDNSLMYFGHGTVESNTVDLIFNDGLKVKNSDEVRGYDNNLRGLDSTTVALGFGSEELFNEQSNLLNNWPHKDAKNIVIVSIPTNYAFFNYETSNSMGDPYEQFYINKGEQGYFLRPEFIKGVYDANSKEFIPNKNFYMNLSIEDKKKLFEELDINYIKAYTNNVSLAPDFFDRELPLSGENIDKLFICWYTKQLQKLYKYNMEQEKKQVEDEYKSEISDDSWVDFDWDDDELSEGKSK